jgi:hypothetical protein
MSYPTVQGRAAEGTPYREARVNLGKKFANSYYLFFLAGTSTPANVYQNGTLTTPFSPTGRVTADGFGRFAAIYLDPSVIYRVQFFNAANVQQWQVDPYVSQLSTVGTSSLRAFGFQIAPTGEITLDAPNAGGTNITLTLKSGSLGTSALQLAGTLPGNSTLIVNNSATTGAQTATFVAANKPGTATSAPAGWLPITCDGVQYYTPIWHGNPFTPYISSPSALGEVINATSVMFGGNGLTTATGGTAVPSNWFTPATTNVGTGYYINITKTSGTVNFSAAQGAWTNITGAGLNIVTSAQGVVNGTYQLSTSVTGSPVVANGTINLSSLTVLHVFTSGSGSDAIPLGTTTVRMEVWGSGGGGGGAHSATGGGFNMGGDGGCGGFSYSVYAASALGGGGGTFNYSVPSGGAGGAYNGGDGTAGTAGSITAGTVTGFTTMTANGGGPGLHATGGADGSQGAGGTATGGNTTNTTGSGTAGTVGSIASDGSPYGAAGGGGVNLNGAGNIGQNGAVVFFYT